MKFTWFAVFALLAAGCTNGYQPPALPTAPSTTSSGVPATIHVVGGSRPDQQLDITAQVLTADGKFVPNIPVQFSITNGVVNPVTAMTDANGNAKTVAATFAAATITATIGTGLSGSGVFTIASGLPLGVTLSAPSVVVGSTSTLTASANSAALGGPYSYTWSFGDGKGDAGSAASISHAYPGIGAYNASVTIKDGAGRTATGVTVVSVTDVPVATPAPTTPAAAGLVASLNCTASAHGSPSPCNVSVTYNGTALASTAITGIAWDWGDGSTVAGAAVPLGSHSYAQAGVYNVTATVTATTTDGSKTAPIVSRLLTVS